MPVNLAKEFLKSMNTDVSFFGLFFQNFEFLFPSFGKFFKKKFCEKSFQMVSFVFISSLMPLKTRQPWIDSSRHLDT